MEQYPIPQFIEEEGRIISFLTFRQFFWLVGAGGACILWYYILPFPIFALLSLITVALVVVIAFVKVDNVSVIKIFLNFIGFSLGTKTYTWKRKEEAHPLAVQKKPEPSVAEQVEAPKIQQSKLNNIRKLIETKK